MKKTKQYLPSIMILSIPMLIGSILAFSHKAVADSIVDSVSIRVPAACTLSSSIAQGQAHNANIAGGVYEAEIGTTNLKIVCNDNGGFSLYAVGFTDDVHGKTALSSSLGSSYDIMTGTAEDGNISNWAMKVKTIPNATYNLSIENGFDSYSEVPSRFVKVATRNAGTDVGQQAVGSSLTTTYAAYISKTQPAGSYVGQVKYTLVHPYDLDPPQDYETESGYIGYYPNATSYVGVMARQAIGQSDTSATLSASAFKREGYGFAGWNDRFDYTGTFYGPNEDIIFDAGQYSGDNKGLSLYAVWVKSEGYLQEWHGCSPLAQWAVTALTDKRDNQTYAVAKLSDNKCWLIENMRIDGNVDSQIMATESDAIGSGFSVLPPSSNDWNNLDSTLPQLNDNNLTEHYSLGNYYSWSAAIANTSNAFSSDETANTSICPLGWRLPIGGPTNLSSNNDYLALMQSVTNEGPNINESTNYGYYDGANYSSAIRKYPNNFIYAGYWNKNATASQNESGYYWSSTSYSSGSAYYFYLGRTIIRPGNAHTGKYNGQTFRCISTN